MKKLSAMLLSIVLVLALTVTAFAAGSVSLKPSATEVKQGDSVTVSVSLADMDAITSMGLTFAYDKNIFEFVKGEWKYDDALIKTADADKAALAFSAAAKKSGEAFVLTLKAKADAAIAKKDVAVTYVAKNSTTVVVEGTAKVQLSVVCKEHKFSDWKVTAEASCTAKGSQERTCETCKLVEKKDIAKLGHKYGTATVKQEATISTPGLKEAVCSRCSNVKKTELPCEMTDAATGTKFEANKGVFAEGTTLTVAAGTDSAAIQGALKDVSGKYSLYDIAATNAPNGTVKATFPVASDFGTNVGLYLIGADGTATKVEGTLKDGKFTADLSAMGTYALCDLDVAANVTDPTTTPSTQAPTTTTTPDSGADAPADNSLWLILAIVAAVVIIILIVIVVAKKKKN